MINLLTGPVEVHPEARRAMLDPAAPHRARAFLDEVAATQAALCALTGASRAQLLLGSGTLANDAVAAQLSRRRARGLVLSNGEFGERLVDHATRFGLSFEVLRRPWGAPIAHDAVDAALRAGSFEWLWCVQLETSTGVLNDVGRISARCEAAGVDVCLDTISALGLVPLDLARVRFATGVSGKGLRAYPGLALVFYNDAVTPDPALPRYLDLGLYEHASGVPFTHSSNLVSALRRALLDVGWTSRHASIRHASTTLRGHLRAQAFEVVAADADAAPGVVTIALPAVLPSERIAEGMEAAGIRLGAGSDYLRDRNWIQISLMSGPTSDELDRTVRALCEVRARCAHTAGVAAGVAAAAAMPMTARPPIALGRVRR